MATALQSDVEARVAKGAAVLDETRSEWWKPGVIDLTTLNMGSYCGCILGQVAGHFHSGIQDIAGKKPRTRDAFEWAADHGFDARDDSGIHWREGYAALRAAWVALIESRRTEAACSLS